MTIRVEVTLATGRCPAVALRAAGIFIIWLAFLGFGWPLGRGSRPVARPHRFLPMATTP